MTRTSCLLYLYTRSDCSVTTVNYSPIVLCTNDCSLIFFCCSVYNKIRLLILYILYKKGVSRDDFLKLMQHSEIPQNERFAHTSPPPPHTHTHHTTHTHTHRKVILNLMHLGHTILQEEPVKGSKHHIKFKERLGEKYEVSRWTPLVQDIAEVLATSTCLPF